MQDKLPALPADIAEIVALALTEDIGDGDITAQLIDEKVHATAQIICKENAVLCGVAWAEAVFRMVDPGLQIDWAAIDGQEINNGTTVALISGSARSILTGERTALNFLQTLSGTATVSRRYAKLVEHTRVKLLDTRKTLPGLRTAQKYAVRIGGCHNHRMGLFDAFLIKENHIAACGGIQDAISRAKSLHPDKQVEIEIQSLGQLEQAIAAGPDVVMLDNFALQEIIEAVAINRGRLQLEASGGISAGSFNSIGFDSSTLVKIAESGVDYISLGYLTKHCHAIDYSLLIDKK